MPLIYNPLTVGIYEKYIKKKQCTQDGGWNREMDRYRYIGYLTRQQRKMYPVIIIINIINIIITSYITHTHGGKPDIYNLKIVL